MAPELIFYLVLLIALVLLVTGVLRYDLVALTALLVLIVTGLIPADSAFEGFGNPAVVTVVAVLVISKALEAAGIPSFAGRIAGVAGSRPTLQILFFCVVVGFLSAFMNNVGALALMMPVAIEIARREKRAPYYLLMPMAFASLLGGMTTLIGTPPNLLISNYRKSHHGEPFLMFDFFPVGLPIAIAGIVFIALIGWRLIPRRKSTAGGDLFDIGNYLTEVVVPEECPSIGKPVREMLSTADDIALVSFRRSEQTYLLASQTMLLAAGDVMILRAGPRALKEFVDKNKLKLDGVEPSEADVSDENTKLVEVVVIRGGTAERSSARRLSLRKRFGINMIAISRVEKITNTKLTDTRFRAGDVLLLQMPVANMRDSLQRLGLLPLAQRGLNVLRVPRLTLALSIFLIAIIITSFGWLSSAIAFSIAAVTMILCRVITIREGHEAIDWSIVILLGAMIPVGTAFETSGAVDSLMGFVSSIDGIQSPVVMLTILLLITMLLSDILNNAATAIVMAPVASATAVAMNTSADPFLLAVAIGASCAFLTPIGHQSNTLVLGPGGYHFGDYFRMGIILEVIVVLVAIPTLCWFWGLGLQS